MENEWTKLTVHCHRGDLETVCAFMSMLDNGLQIEDYSDVRCDPVYGDLIDEAILKADPDKAAVVEAFLADRIAELLRRGEEPHCVPSP